PEPGERGVEILAQLAVDGVQRVRTVVRDRRDVPVELVEDGVTHRGGRASWRRSGWFRPAATTCTPRRAVAATRDRCRHGPRSQWRRPAPARPFPTPAVARDGR